VRIVKAEDIVDLTHFQMKKRPVPEHVIGKIVDVRQPIFKRLEPDHAFARPTLHFHDMCNAMPTPSIIRRQPDTAPTGHFRGPIVARFFEGKTIAA